jgi:hypothetical protein
MERISASFCAVRNHENLRLAIHMALIIGLYISHLACFNYVSVGRDQSDSAVRCYRRSWWLVELTAFLSSDGTWLARTHDPPCSFHFEDKDRPYFHSSTWKISLPSLALQKKPNVHGRCRVSHWSKPHKTRLTCYRFCRGFILGQLKFEHGSYGSGWVTRAGRTGTYHYYPRRQVDAGM